MAFLRYSVLRLGFFALGFFLAYTAIPLGLLPRMLVALAVGFVISAAVGYLFFNSWRLAAAEQLAGWLGRRRPSSAESADNAAEDQLAEQFHEEVDAQQQAIQKELRREDPEADR
ncbi:DUF4229 domain-containing protein [Nesterenkonia alkaliphila]|uniref:DUF4229 domain-containing protein n=1 Tax=Nesterenkonia alkaliphila TaxID=1463631 RepID=A0A7K1UI24_9MICC|nr:DUF4229 domain-containing protein [Nesterenkonia alkaliphila]MVT26117.1 DUF4229 domain-containing protein [Nesterenkonia alkaliphila]GFZ91975.1 hypothetical protein GCM10011359_21610 [Nesterenkonia alkaliphila]